MRDETVVVSIRVPESLVKRLDTIAQQELRTRVNVIHLLLTEALAARDAHSTDRPAKIVHK